MSTSTILKVLALIAIAAPGAAAQSFTAADGSQASAQVAWTCPADQLPTQPFYMAVNPQEVYILSLDDPAGPTLMVRDIATGNALGRLPLTPASLSSLPSAEGVRKITEIGTDPQGSVWGAAFDAGDSPAVTLMSIHPGEGVCTVVATASLAELSPGSYHNLAHQAFGPVSVDGSIAYGTATVAFVEVVKDVVAETSSLRLWRIYGAFGATADVTARYSDLLLPNVYPYQTVTPDAATQVVLTSLTGSITDNTADVPYFYTTRASKQQASERYTTPAAPQPEACGIHLMQWGDATWLLYAAEPGVVNLVRFDDLDRGFAPDNLEFAASLTLPAESASSPFANSPLRIGSAAVGADRMVCVSSYGASFTAFRLTTGNGGVESVECAPQQPFAISSHTLTADQTIAVYAPDGRLVAQVPAGESINLTTGIYVVRGDAGAQIIAVR